MIAILKDLTQGRVEGGRASVTLEGDIPGALGGTVCAVIRTLWSRPNTKS